MATIVTKTRTAQQRFKWPIWKSLTPSIKSFLAAASYEEASANGYRRLEEENQDERRLNKHDGQTNGTMQEIYDLFDVQVDKKYLAGTNNIECLLVWDKNNKKN